MKPTTPIICIIVLLLAPVFSTKASTTKPIQDIFKPSTNATQQTPQIKPLNVASFVEASQIPTPPPPTTKAPVVNTNPTNAGNWAGVANCESTGNWSINTGNGFSGGLQFTPSTWAAYGGLAYAPAAYLASEADQIVVANAVLAGQGIGAWPVCGAYY